MLLKKKEASSYRQQKLLQEQQQQQLQQQQNNSATTTTTNTTIASSSTTPNTSSTTNLTIQSNDNNINNNTLQQTSTPPTLLPISSSTSTNLNTNSTTITSIPSSIIQTSPTTTTNNNSNGPTTSLLYNATTTTTSPTTITSSAYSHQQVYSTTINNNPSTTATSLASSSSSNNNNNPSTIQQQEINNEKKRNYEEYQSLHQPIDSDSEDDEQQDENQQLHSTTSITSPSNRNKNVKLDNNNNNIKESKVLLFSNLPINCQKSEILDYDSEDLHFQQVFIFRQNQQNSQSNSGSGSSGHGGGEKFLAFVEFENIEKAKEFLMKHETLFIRGRTVYVKYSEKDKLEITNSSSSNTSGSGGVSGSSMNSSSSGGYSPNIIHITFTFCDEQRYPMTVDILYQVFIRFGAIEKINIFLKNELTQALIQFRNKQDAKRALEEMDGQWIYPGHGASGHAGGLLRLYRMHIQFSRRYTNDLTLRQGNTARSRDFTRYSSPPSSSSSTMPPYHHGGYHGGNAHYQHEPIDSYAPPPHQGYSSSSSHPGHHNGMPSYPPLMDTYSAGHHVPSPHHAPPPHPHHSFPIPPYPSLSVPPPTTVLVVRNLPKNVTCDHLFILFGLYGDVIKVLIKMSSNTNNSNNQQQQAPHPHIAFVQFKYPHEVVQAIRFLYPRGIPLYGSELHVEPSYRVFEILPPNNNKKSGDAIFKSYENSPLHRFTPRKGTHESIAANWKKVENICPPSNILHISNISANTMEDKLRNEIERLNTTIISFRFIDYKARQTSDHKIAQKKSAIVEMSSTQDAVIVLAELHDLLMDDHHLNIKFSNRIPSKKQISSSTNNMPLLPPLINNRGSYHEE